jgi:hypothetical protein
MLDLGGCTATHRLTCPGWAVGLVADAAGLLLTAGSAVAADEVSVADVVAFEAALAVLVWVCVAVELVDGLAVAVVVLGLADVDAFEDADELVVAVAVRVEGEGSVLTVGDFEEVAVGVAVAEVLTVGSLVDGCGLGEPLGVAVGVGVAVGEEVDSGNGWHCCTAPVDAATAAVSSTGWAAGAASENPEAAAARTPPVTTPTITGCTCAIRMKGPARAVRGMPCSCRTPPLDTNDSAQC